MAGYCRRLLRRCPLPCFVVASSALMRLACFTSAFVPHAVAACSCQPTTLHLAHRPVWLHPTHPHCEQVPLFSGLPKPAQKKKLVVQFRMGISYDPADVKRNPDEDEV